MLDQKDAVLIVALDALVNGEPGGQRHEHAIFAVREAIKNRGGEMVAVVHSHVLADLADWLKARSSMMWAEQFNFARPLRTYAKELLELRAKLFIAAPTARKASRPDGAVDRFAAIMKAKMAISRAMDRAGWNNGNAMAPLNRGEAISARRELTDAEIDKMLRARIPGGSDARDWFLPHESDQAQANIRAVVRAMFATHQGI